MRVAGKDMWRRRWKNTTHAYPWENVEGGKKRGGEERKGAGRTW